MNIPQSAWFVSNSAKITI